MPAKLVVFAPLPHWSSHVLGSRSVYICYCFLMSLESNCQSHPSRPRLSLQVEVEWKWPTTHIGHKARLPHFSKVPEGALMSTHEPPELERQIIYMTQM